ncbi:MAG: hypothetical protein EXS03_06685 [Phycisphaerales bacterium]|nr:hypothetical protein [Phycisphaerales bacterium]
MYGMVNKAIEDLVTIKFGPDQRKAVKKKAGVTIDTFISNDAYDDSITYGLVGAASVRAAQLHLDIVLTSGFWSPPYAHRMLADVHLLAGRPDLALARATPR